jgi:hypothetical protein
MHRRLQFGLRENPASDRRHGSRFEVESLSNGTRTEKASVASEELAPVHIHSPAAGHGTVNAAPLHAATGEKGTILLDILLFWWDLACPRTPCTTLNP